MHQARKRFGQNFLQDASIIQQILACAGPRPGEHWLEIGPGLGALTQPLLNTGAIVDAIELDRDLAAHLRRRFLARENFTLHNADALAFDIRSIAKPGEKLKIIGNLPYNISTPLLFHLLEYSDLIADMLFMLQKEVVDRLCAEPGCKQYGRLTVMTRYFCQAEYVFDVPPESFHPVPKVMSAIIRLTPHPSPPAQVGDLPLFQELVTRAFSQRRKTLRNTLKPSVNAEQLQALGLDPGLRAEALSLSDFALLARWAAAQKTTA